MAGFEEPAHPTDVIHFITEFPFWLQAFDKLESVTVAILFIEDIFDEDLQLKLLEALMHRIYKKTGVKGQFIRQELTRQNLGWMKHWHTFEDENDIQPLEDLDWQVRYPRLVRGNVDIWTWKAADGKFMDWSQDLGWEWDVTHLLTYDDPEGELDEIACQKEVDREWPGYVSSNVDDDDEDGEGEDEVSDESEE